MEQTFLSLSFFENTGSSYCWFAGIILCGIIFKRFISVRLSRLLYSLLRHYSQGVSRESFEQLLIKPMNTLIILLFFYAAFDQLVFPNAWNLAPEEKFGLRMILFRTYHVTLIFVLTWIILRIVDFFALVMMHKAEQTETKTDDQIIPFIKDGAKIIVAGFSFFVILGTVFNVNITSIIAGLGIGGLAIALAAKETLENLLGSFTIFMDKPFVLGDYVRVGTVTGYVEKIGFRSTRIRTLEKSYVTVPNKKMVDAETENLSMRTARRGEYSIMLSYSTSHEQIKKILLDINLMLEKNPLVDKSDVTVRFLNFGTSALEIKLDFYFMVRSNNDFFRAKEEVNFSIMEIVAANGSGFALPGTVVYNMQK